MPYIMDRQVDKWWWDDDSDDDGNTEEESDEDNGDDKLGDLTLKVLNFWKFTSYCSLIPLWSYLADPTSPIPSHCALIVVTSTLRVNMV